MKRSGKKGLSLQAQMLIGFVLGLTAGLIVHVTAVDAAWVKTVTTYVTQPIGQIFLRLLFMLVIPPLFSALVMGIAEMGDIGSLKRVGLNTLAFTIGISSVGVVLVSSPASERLKEVIEGLFEVSMRLTGLVIRIAPIAVACFMFNLAALFGWELLERLGANVGVVLLALSLHMFIVYPIIVRLFGGMSPLYFLRQSQEAMVTASSNATLPKAIRVAEQKLLLPPRVARFVLTIGATANQNGTAIFEGITVLFLAQFFGVELGLFEQFMLLLVCILGGIGAAGVPAGALPVVALILGMVGVPPEGIGLVLGVDRFLDMCRTALNVTGDRAAAVVISRGEAGATVAEEP